MKPKAVLFFEPVNHILKVVEAAHKQGLAPVAIHSMPLSSRPPYGHAVSFIQATHEIPSWKDEAVVMAAVDSLAERFDIVGTYAAADITLRFDSTVRKRLGLPHNDPSVIAEVLDKQRVRTRLRAANLTALACYSEEELATWTKWPDGFVGYFKPVSGGGSAYVHRCTGQADYDAALASWNAKSEVTVALLKDFIEARNAYFMEEAAPGELVSLESLSWKGELRVLGLTSRTVLKSNQAVEMGGCFPYAHPHLDKIIEKVRRIHETLGVTHGPTHTELMVTPDGGIELVELNVRFPGADMLMVINAAYQCDIQEVLLALACGQPIPPELDETPPRCAALQNFLALPGEVLFKSIEFPDGDIVFQRVMVPEGAHMPQSVSQEGLIASFIAVADDYGQLMTRLREMRYGTKVNGHIFGDQPNNTVVLR